MKCPKCGKQNKLGTKACTKCGEKLVSKKKTTKIVKPTLKTSKMVNNSKKTLIKAKKIVKIKKTEAEIEEELEPTLKLELQSLIKETRNYKKLEFLTLLKKIPKKIWLVVSSVVVILVVVTYLLFEINHITCKYSSKEDNLRYKSLISFRYKGDEVTSFKMKIEYYSYSSKYANDFTNFYDNIIGNLEGLKNFRNIISASKGSKHFSVVYNFGNKYLDKVNEYTGFELDNYDNINTLVDEIELSGFECN